MTEQEFFKEVLESELPVLVDFWATWCSPCKILAPTLDQITADYAGKVKVVKIDVDESSDLTQALKIMSVPTLLFVQEGVVVDRLLGLQSKKQIEDRLAKIL